MTINELHWAVKHDYNKLLNNKARGLTDVEIDRVLNISISDYIDMFYHGTNVKQINVGFEVNQQRLDMLQTLVVEYPEIDLITPQPNPTDGVYKFKLENLSIPFRSYIDSSKLKVKDCDYDFSIDIEKHNYDLDDYHKTPSKLWQRAVGKLRRNSLFIYTNSEFEPTGLKLTYLKKPNEVCLGTYPELADINQLNPTNKQKVECDLPLDYHNLLVLIAVQNLQRIYENPAEQFSMNKINNLV